MGKGDKKTKRGKIHRGTFGVLRPRGKKAKAVVVSKPKKEAPKKASAKKAVAKKEA